MILTAVLVLGLVGPSTWQPSRRSLPSTLEESPLTPHRGVITQARARQRRRHRNIAATAAATGAEAAARVAGIGSPLSRRKHSRHDHSATPSAPARAERLPGLPADSSPALVGLSCPSAGNCALDGIYHHDGNAMAEMFVANEVHGRWGKAETIRSLPGVYGLMLFPVSCSSPGNCLAGGYYHPTANPTPGDFVVAERNGIWGSVQRIPSASRINSIDTGSCSPAGTCTVGGLVTVRGPRHGRVLRPFIASETNGRLGGAHPIPGVPVQQDFPDPLIWNISCTSVGNCSAAGTYGKTFHKDIGQGVFTVSEKNRVWGSAELLHGIVDQLRNPGITQISCASAGNCSLIGDSSTNGNPRQNRAFVASQVDGIWNSSEPIPGIKNDDAVTEGLSCPAPGECTVDGDYGPWLKGQGLYGEPFTVTETDGIWHDAQEVPGIARPQRVVFGPISCADAGDCLAGGYLSVSGVSEMAMNATETDGVWRNAQEVPGISALFPRGVTDKGAETALISCPTVSSCVSAGTYRGTFIRTHSDLQQVFVAG